MRSAALVIAFAASAAAQTAEPAPDIRLLALAGADSSLAARVKTHPGDVREALRLLLAAAARESGDSAAAALAAARRVAFAYATTWDDSFLVREVARFESFTAAQRQLKVSADSLRLAGNRALATSGAPAATRYWRESLSRMERVPDTAGVAAALGNLGIAFYHQEGYDSAATYLGRSLSFAEQVGDRRTIGNALGAMADMHRTRGALAQARELYARASDVRRTIGDDRGLAADRNNMGLIAQDLGDLSEARRAFLAALDMNRRAARDDAAATNLVNLGNLASGESDYAEAAARYREALAIYRALGNEPDIAFVLHNIGILMTRRGDYRSAASALTEATSIYRRHGVVDDEIAVRRDLSAAYGAMGDLQSARRVLDAATHIAQRREGSDRGAQLTLEAGLALARADLEVQFNRLTEAERQYARATDLARAARDVETMAGAQQGMGYVLLARQRYSRARETLDLALRAQEGIGDRRGAAITRLLIGHAAVESGDTARARLSFRAALDSLVRLGDVVGEAAALAALGDLEARSPLWLTADSLYRRGIARLGDRSAPEVSWRLHAGRARALRSLGQRADAVGELTRAIAEVERVSGVVRSEERRADYLADKWDVYVNLALLERERGAIENAFAASERLRARQLLDLLARGRVETDGAVAQGADATLEQDLRRRIAELQTRIAAASDSGLREPALAASRGAALEALGQAQASYSELLVRMKEAHPAYAALVRGEVASASDVRSRLAGDEAFVEYLLGDSTSLAFVVTRDSINAVDLNVTRRALAALVEFTRATLTSPTDSAARRGWPAPLRRLHRQLIAPIEERGLLAGKRRLIIAPHAELHYLPFAALMTSENAHSFLVQRYVIDYVPSASVWLEMRARPTSEQRGGVLALAPRPTSLPGSLAEVRAIGTLFGRQARVLTGSDATEAALRARAPDHAIVHLATYGVLNKHNPLFSYVDLGAGGAHDGRLEVHEVFSLALNARLLVLSACQTGLGSGALADVPEGDDWVGLVRAFLYAGASNVLATLWPVQDLATASLMERFYQGLSAGRTIGESLAEAQRAAIQSSRTSHPFYWGGFALVTGGSP